MVHKKPVIVRAADAAKREGELFQRLNPRAKFFSTGYARLAGLERVGVARGRIPPGGEAFAYHAHLREEEWVYILDGRARAKLDGETVELATGDFVAFPAPQAPHILTNPYDTDCVYLFGGERTGAPDVLAYPELDKQYLLMRSPTNVAFHELGSAEFPFGAGKTKPWHLLAGKGCGSAIAELALAWTETAYEREEASYETEDGRARLLPFNPLMQVPTAILPDGTVMTETLAIIHHLDEIEPGAGLLPHRGDPLRREALRWLTFIVAAIYPTWTYGDDPAKWGCGDELRASTDAHRIALWTHLETVARGPWFLGERFSAIDLYIGVMTHWRPRRAWFEQHAPKLAAIATAVIREPRLAPIFAANFS